jgi:hypothetical protein
MSTLSMISEDEPQDLPKIPPAEVGSLMTAWWLVIGFSLIAYLAVLPMAPSPLAQNDSITKNGWLLYGGLAVLLLAVGTFIGVGMRRGNPSALRFCKIGLIFAIILEVGAVAAVLVLASTKPAPATATPVATSSSSSALPLGPKPELGIILLGFVVLLPICFAILSFSLSSSMRVREWFYPPEEEHPAEGAAWGAAAGAGLAGAGVGAALHEGAGLEHAPPGLEAAPPEHFEPHMGHDAMEATVPPELGPQPIAGAGRPTMIASEEEVAGAVHAEPEAEHDAMLDAGPAASGSHPHALPEETPVDAPDAEAELGEDVVYAEETGDVAAEPVEYVVEEAPGDEVVEEVVEEELPSAEAHDGDGTDVKPVDTWHLKEEEDKDHKKKK